MRTEKNEELSRRHETENEALKKSNSQHQDLTGTWGGYRVGWRERGRWDDDPWKSWTVKKETKWDKEPGKDDSNMDAWKDAGWWLENGWKSDEAWAKDDWWGERHVWAGGRRHERRNEMVAREGERNTNDWSKGAVRVHEIKSYRKNIECKQRLSTNGNEVKEVREMVRGQHR